MKKRKRRKTSKGGRSRQKMKAKMSQQDPEDTHAQSQYWWPSDTPRMKCAWFWIPLQVPLKLPDGFMLPIGSPHNFHYPDQDLTEIIGFTGPLDKPFGISISICVHQIEGYANNSQLEAAMAASQRRPGVDEPDNVPLDTPVVTTVLECVASLGDTSLDMEEAPTLAFENILREVNNFLRGYAISTQNRVALVHKEALPFAIPAWWSEDRDHAFDLPSGEQYLFLVNLFDSSIMGMSATRTEDMSEEEIVELLDHGDALADSLMVEIYTMFLDARLALQRGEHAVSVVLLASGCELYLRLLHEVLLWEDGVSPKDASNDLFGSNDVGLPVSYILKSKFHGRLGGIWDITSTSNLVGLFYKEVFERRNRYLHIGRPITESDADAASDATTSFLEFVNTRLSEKLTKYPLAANLLIGEPAITHMGIRERIDTALLAKESELPLSPLMYDCSSHFGGYRREVRLYQGLDARSGAPLVGEINEETHIAAFIYPDGTIEHWLVDPNKSVACRAEKPNMSAQQAKILKRLKKQARRQSPNELNVCRLFDVSATPLESPPTWVSAHAVWRMEHMQG